MSHIYYDDGRLDQGVLLRGRSDDEVVDVHQAIFDSMQGLASVVADIAFSGFPVPDNAACHFPFGGHPAEGPDVWVEVSFRVTTGPEQRGKKEGREEEDSAPAGGDMADRRTPGDIRARLIERLKKRQARRRGI